MRPLLAARRAETQILAMLKQEEQHANASAGEVEERLNSLIEPVRSSAPPVAY